jgi:hypothetical protein
VKLNIKLNLSLKNVTFQLQSNQIKFGDDYEEDYEEEECEYPEPYR